MSYRANRGQRDWPRYEKARELHDRGLTMQKIGERLSISRSRVSFMLKILAERDHRATMRILERMVPVGGMQSDKRFLILLPPHGGLGINKTIRLFDKTASPVVEIKVLSIAIDDTCCFITTSDFLEDGFPTTITVIKALDMGSRRQRVEYMIPRQMLDVQREKILPEK